MARKKFQLTGPAVQRGGSTVRELEGREFVYIDQYNVKSDGTPVSDSDRETYVHTTAVGGYGHYVLTSSLSKIEERAAFEKGDLVLVSADAKTSGGGSVYFGGAVVATVERTYAYGGRTDVDVTSTGGKYQTVGDQYLTKLPTGVDLAQKVTRPELAFEDAIRKAAAHRDAVEGKGSTEALIELAKLLVEVAK